MSKRRLISIMLSLVMVLASFGTFAFAVDNTDSAAAAKVGKKYTDKQLGISSAGKKLDKKYRTVLIAGTDDGNRSDLIILLSINKSNGAAKILSVTRDTYMQISDKKKYKIDGKTRDFAKCNKAYELGSDPTLQMMRALNRHLDTNIREYIAVSWECTAALVDELNSLGYKVTGKITNTSMRNAINTLTPIEKKISGTGTVKLKGWQAVQYLRVRKYSGGDANARENRNRAFLIQLSKTARKKMTPKDVKKVYNAVKGKLKTNMNWEQLNTMLVHLGNIKDDTHARTWPYKSTAMWDPDGYFTYVIPTTLTDNVKMLHKEIYPKVSYSPSSTEKSLSKKIESKRKNYLLKKRPTLASAKIKTTSGIFTGSSVKTHPKVTLGGRELIEGSDYKVVSYKNNKGVGKATFKIKGIYYTGSKSGSFIINPANTEFTEPDEISANGFTLNWEKQDAKMTKKHITGYKLQYGTSKSFKKATSKTVKGYGKTSLRISGLKSGKSYYVRIRTYMTIGKKTYYSPWGEVLNVVTE